VWQALYEIDTARAAVEFQTAELKTVTIIGVYRRNAPELPAFVKEGKARQSSPTEYFMACKEWVAGTYRQMNAFYGHASHDVLFTAPGQPDVRGHLNGHTVSSGDGNFQAYGVVIVAEDQSKIVPGVAYDIKPINTDTTYRWQVSDHFAPVKLQE
jgi:hypothetical protein